MFAVLGRLAFRFRWPIIVLYGLCAPIGAILSMDVLQLLRAGGFEDMGAESWQVRDELINELQVGHADIIALYSVRSGTVDDIEVLSEVVAATERITKDPALVRVMSTYETGAPQLISRDRQKTFVLISLRGDDQDKSRAFDRMKPLLTPDDTTGNITIQFAGITPVNQALFRTIERDLRRAELIAFPLTAALLIFVFGSLTSTILPLLLGLLSVIFAFVALRILTMFTELSVFSANIVSIMGLGLAIDYSLFLVSRFREEMALDPSLSVEVAITKTVSTTGRAVAFSGVTVAASLCGLFAYPQMYLRSVAAGGIVVVAGSIVMAMTFLPALLAVLGPRIDTLRVPFAPAYDKVRRREDDDNSFWMRIARMVMKRPLLVAVLIVVPLLLLATPFARFDASIPDARILPKDTPARLAVETLEREFLPNQITPHDVLVRLPVDALSNDGLVALLPLYRAIKAIPGIASVDSPLAVVDALGQERGLRELKKPAAERNRALQAGIEMSIRGNLANFAIVSSHGFNRPEALAQVTALRSLTAPPGATIKVGGVSAVLFDLKHVVRARLPHMLGVVLCAMFVVLFLVFGSVTLPIKAMLMNSLSLTASYGAMVWVFQDGRFTSILRYEPLGISEAMQPILLFAVVFGLSMDYEVLLLSRVREEYLRTGDNDGAVAHGLARTGRLITSAAAILVVVIGAFVTSDILFMKTLGVGMALAVALDATVIRALLVPATMKLMGKWNWWAPRPLRWLWEKIGLSDH